MYNNSDWHGNSQIEMADSFQFLVEGMPAVKPRKVLMIVLPIIITIMLIANIVA